MKLFCLLFLACGVLWCQKPTLDSVTKDVKQASEDQAAALKKAAADQAAASAEQATAAAQQAADAKRAAAQQAAASAQQSADATKAAAQQAAETKKAGVQAAAVAAQQAAAMRESNANQTAFIAQQAKAEHTAAQRAAGRESADLTQYKLNQRLITLEEAQVAADKAKADAVAEVKEAAKQVAADAKKSHDDMMQLGYKAFIALIGGVISILVFWVTTARANKTTKNEVISAVRQNGNASSAEIDRAAKRLYKYTHDFVHDFNNVLVLVQVKLIETDPHGPLLAGLTKYLEERDKVSEQERLELAQETELAAAAVASKQSSLTGPVHPRLS